MAYKNKKGEIVLDKEDDKFIEKAVDIPKAGLDMDPKPFMRLLSKESDLKIVYECLETTIWRSFAEDLRSNPFKEQNITQNEIRHRFKLCEKWFRKARGEYGFSLEKTLDLMPKALRSDIEGEDFDPTKSKTKLWTPT